MCHTVHENTWELNQWCSKHQGQFQRWTVRSKAIWLKRKGGKPWECSGCDRCYVPYLP